MCRYIGENKDALGTLHLMMIVASVCLLCETLSVSAMLYYYLQLLRHCISNLECLQWVGWWTQSHKWLKKELGIAGFSVKFKPMDWKAHPMTT